MFVHMGLLYCLVRNGCTTSKSSYANLQPHNNRAVAWCGVRGNLGREFLTPDMAMTSTKPAAWTNTSQRNSRIDYLMPVKDVTQKRSAHST